MDGKHEELITYLSSGMSQRARYFGTHPRVRECAEGFARALERALAVQRREAFFLGVAEGRLVHDGSFLLGATLFGKRVVTLAQQLRCGGFLFRRGASEREVGELFTLAVELQEPLESLEVARDLAASRGMARVELSPEYEDPGWFGQYAYDGRGGWRRRDGEDAHLESVLPVYQLLFETVENAQHAALAGQELDFAAARTASEQLLRAAQGSLPDVMQLVRYRDAESYTTGHSVRVALLAVTVGHGLGASRELLTELGTAALLHDVGKARIPREILYKPGALDESERRAVEEHPVVGATVLLESRGASPLAIACAFGHHLRADGGGYPRVRPWAIRNRITALVQACDVFEALTAARPHKRPVSARRAYEVMVADPGAIDPGGLAALVRTIGFYPPGSHVRLSTGQRARVLAAGEDPALPQVELTHGAEGTVYEPRERRAIDLATGPADGTHVACSLPPPGQDPDAAGVSAIADLRA